MNTNLFLKQIEQSNLAVNSLILLQNGRTLVESYRKPYRKDTKQLLFSLSKSVTSIAVGIAWDNGYLSLDDQVISFFPDKLPESISDHLAKMTVHHLLAMNAGHHHNIYSQVAESTDWVGTFLSLDVEHEPGSYYRYSTHSTYMLSAILERATGQKLVDFLMPRLFEPLSISRPTWESCPTGITAGGMGLSLSTADIARFGQMLLNKGEFAGHRVVSEAFLERAVSEQSDNRRDENRIDFAQGYGYQFFLCRDGCFMGNGGFGQLCFVAPKQGIVIATTSGMPSTKELQLLLDLIYEHILKGEDEDGFLVSGEGVLNPEIAGTNRISQPIPESIPELNDACYALDNNPLGIRRLKFALRDKQLDLRLIYEDRERRLVFNFERLAYTQDTFIKDLALHEQEAAICASWLTNTILELTMVYFETPYIVTYTFTFENQRLLFQFHQNVSLGLKECSMIGQILN
ncbi:CubicO group peptidase (beta-lactamase class C family) [Paenibacillus castaneae]|uniref:serine hydrolase domain-containing protein n=1 Tax=Paenibacillus castaneae TaxID=474957 RepID=UPI001FD2FA23|nr:serine hydrolase [Paenibacillus castaneae]NIK78931.1 CubicO group peptidase (beta-lactamase class C family) [Paenibacillus castaneae]